jgi:hypothetical protein
VAEYVLPALSALGPLIDTEVGATSGGVTTPKTVPVSSASGGDVFPSTETVMHGGVPLGALWSDAGCQTWVAGSHQSIDASVAPPQISTDTSPKEDPAVCWTS